MSSENRARARRGFWILLVLTLLGAVYLAFLYNADRAVVVPKPNERSRKQLELKNNRWYDGQQLFSGIIFDQYEGGEIRSRSTVSNGLLEGLSEGWYTNGTKQVAEHFSRGISNGLRTKFHPNGVKLSEAEIVDGKIEGLFQRWYDNGQLAEKVSLTNGVPDGDSYSYHPDGSLKAHARLEHGKVVEQQFWDQGERK